MWFLIQGVIIFVVFWLLYPGLTQNPMTAGIFGVFAAIAITGITGEVQDWIRGRRSAAQREDQSEHQP